MNFNNSGNNANERANTNTRGIQFMNKNGFFPSTLLVGYWNELISIKFHPALEASQQTESKIFNYDKVVNTALTLEKTTVLIEGLEKTVIPAVEEGKESFKGVPIGGDSLIAVGSKKKEDGTIAAYLGLFKGLNPETMKPESYIYYEFRKGDVIENYSPEDGQFEMSNTFESELMLFTEVLKSARMGLSNAFAHATRTVDRYFRDKLVGQVDSLAEKMGVPTSKGNGGGWSRNSKPDVFGGGNSNTGRSGGSRSDDAGLDAPMERMENIGDINQFLI